MSPEVYYEMLNGLSGVELIDDDDDDILVISLGDWEEATRDHNAKLVTVNNQCRERKLRYRAHFASYGQFDLVIKANLVIVFHRSWNLLD